MLKDSGYDSSYLPTTMTGPQNRNSVLSSNKTSYLPANDTQNLHNLDNLNNDDFEPVLSFYQNELLHQTLYVNGRKIKFYVQAISNYVHQSNNNHNHKNFNNNQNSAPNNQHDNKLDLIKDEIYAVINIKNNSNVLHSDEKHCWYMGCQVGKNALETWKFRSENESFKYFPAGYVKKLTPSNTFEFQQEHILPQQKQNSSNYSTNNHHLNRNINLSQSNTNTSEFSKQKVADYINDNKNRFPTPEPTRQITKSNSIGPTNPLLNSQIIRTPQPRQMSMYGTMTRKPRPNLPNNPMTIMNMRSNLAVKPLENNSSRFFPPANFQKFNPSANTNTMNVNFAPTPTTTTTPLRQSMQMRTPNYTNPMQNSNNNTHQHPQNYPQQLKYRPSSISNFGLSIRAGK